MTKETGGSAFPSDVLPSSGMTLRQYAAIKLKVPDSGENWLDVMITKSLRDDFAAKAMAAILTDGSWHGHSCRSAADTAYEMADEIMKAGQE